MARDLMDDTYYTSTGGKIPVKWTSPEVCLRIFRGRNCVVSICVDFTHVVSLRQVRVVSWL